MKIFPEKIGGCVNYHRNNSGNQPGQSVGNIRRKGGFSCRDEMLFYVIP